MKKKYSALVVIGCLIFLFAYACRIADKKTIAEGEKLALVYCASCHQFPDPALLDKVTWEKGVLPGMAEMMFVDLYYDPFNPSGPRGNDPEDRATPDSLFPYEKWEKIAEYYLSEAPAKLPEREKVLPEIKTGLPHFITQFVYDLVPYPVTSLIKFDTEKTFLPVFGVQKAIPADFDNDGDIDLVSVAFFPDYENLPEEGFIFWENSGEYKYKRYTFEGVADGRWWTMDAADLDKDGDIDIVLGNAFFTMGNVPETLVKKWKKRPLSLVFIENKLK